jgi:uncharacterized membrane protein YdjX (TVP38/TMEM64 family)
MTSGAGARAGRLGLSALAGVLAVGVVALPTVWLLRLDDPVAELERLMEAWGPLATLASIGLMVLHSFVPFPAEMLAIANGMLFGPFWGTVVTWSGAMLGAFLAFGLARHFGRPLVERLMAERHRARIDALSERRGGPALLLSRLIPVISFNLINYAAGLTTISWWTFTWATGLGILPITLASVLTGAGLLHLL